MSSFVCCSTLAIHCFPALGALYKASMECLETQNACFQICKKSHLGLPNRDSWGSWEPLRSLFGAHLASCGGPRWVLRWFWSFFGSLSRRLGDPSGPSNRLKINMKSMLKICMFQDHILKAIWSHFGVILELLLGPHVTHQLHIRNLLKTYKKHWFLLYFCMSTRWKYGCKIDKNLTWNWMAS